MKLDKILNEMGKELLPSLTSKEDLAAIAQLKKLYKKDIEEFTRKLKRINLVRKTEGLEPIHKNEVIGKSIKQDIKKSIDDKNTKDKVIAKKDKTTADNSKSSLKFFQSSYINQDFKKEVKDGKKISENWSIWVGGSDHIIAYSSFGKKFFIVTEGAYQNMKKIIGVYNSPTTYKIVQPNEVRFPELKKKINFAKRDILTGYRPRIEKL